MKAKKMILRTASLIAAAALSAVIPLSVPQGVFTSSSLTAYADDSSGDLYYITEDDHVVITGCKMEASSVEIPASIGGLPVTVINDYAFNGCELSSVKIPDSVKSIGNWSFAMCANLKSVTIPESVESIGIRAFELCSALTEVNFPDKRIELSSRVFDDTPWIAEQRKKDPLVVINGDLIDAQTAKGDVVIPSTVKYVSPSAFHRNENITSVVFPSSVKLLNDSTFFQCSNLVSADVRYVTSIDGFAFAGCNKLTDVKLSGKLTSVNSYAFADNTAKATITVYGSKSDWDKVEKPDDDEYLKNAKYVFDESSAGPADDIAGDVNSDGEFNSADLVLMSKWLLGTPGTELKNWKAGDFISDDKLDIYDLVMMRKALIAK